MAVGSSNPFEKPRALDYLLSAGALAGSCKPEDAVGFDSDQACRLERSGRTHQAPAEFGFQDFKTSGLA